MWREAKNQPHMQRGRQVVKVNRRTDRKGNRNANQRSQQKNLGGRMSKRFKEDRF